MGRDTVLCVDFMQTCQCVHVPADYYFSILDRVTQCPPSSRPSVCSPVCAWHFRNSKMSQLVQIWHTRFKDSCNRTCHFRPKAEESRSRLTRLHNVREYAAPQPTKGWSYTIFQPKKLALLDVCLIVFRWMKTSNREGEQVSGKCN